MGFSLLILFSSGVMVGFKLSPGTAVLPGQYRRDFLAQPVQAWALQDIHIRRKSSQSLGGVLRRSKRQKPQAGGLLPDFLKNLASILFIDIPIEEHQIRTQGQNHVPRQG